VKHIDGHASSLVAAPVEDCFALLAAVHRYPSWNVDLVREVDVLEWAGEDRPARAWARIHVAQSPFGKNFELVVAVRTEPSSAVYLTRLPNEPSDPEQLTLSWRLEQDAGTRIALEFHATVSFLPRFLPQFGVGDLIADTLLDAAVRALGAGP
jgi:ribosome-associated toxin RatA of RatAB toxin-antitoxin module